MKDVLQFFQIQRCIFGVCPRSGDLFRLSDCKVYLKVKPKRDWMDKLDLASQRLAKIEENLDRKESDLREKAREKGRKLAQRVIRKIDPIFTPRRLNPDDAKVIFHPVDYIVFNGMKNSASMKNIAFLDREAASGDRRRLQRSIEKVIEKGRYDWLTIRVLEDGTIKEEE